MATGICNPDAFATVIARGLELRQVRSMLQAPFVPSRLPYPVAIPITDLLGPAGHLLCVGYRLAAPGGDRYGTRAARDAWVLARRSGYPAPVPAPTAEPIGSFEGGTICFRFMPTADRSAYMPGAIYPVPPLRESWASTDGTPYWHTALAARWAALLATIEAHCHPEAWARTWGNACQQLRDRVGDDPAMIAVIVQLRDAISDPAALPSGALGYASGYAAGSDQGFLQWLWNHLHAMGGDRH